MAQMYSNAKTKPTRRKYLYVWFNSVQRFSRRRHNVRKLFSQNILKILVSLIKLFASFFLERVTDACKRCKLMTKADMISLDQMSLKREKNAFFNL